MAAAHRVLMINGVPVITAPREIDLASVIDLELMVLESTSGYATLVIDMSPTRFCDVAGLKFLLRTHRQAVSEGGELRVVIPRGGAVHRAFTAVDLNRHIPRFSTLDQAVAAGPVPTIVPPSAPCLDSLERADLGMAGIIGCLRAG
jgi:anti-anti-sigma factor